MKFQGHKYGVKYNEEYDNVVEVDAVDNSEEVSTETFGLFQLGSEVLS